jgi:hypothetical protein
METPAPINPMSRTAGSAGALLVKANVIGALPPVGYLERSPEDEK